MNEVWVIWESAGDGFRVVNDRYYPSREAVKAAYEAMLDANGDKDRGSTNLAVKQLRIGSDEQYDIFK